MSETALKPMSIAEINAKLTAPGERFEIEEVTIRGARIKTWKNAPRTMRDVCLTGIKTFGPREFLVLEGDRVTYDAFGRAVSVLAKRLAADGVGKGDRVAVVMRNLPEWPVAFFAALTLGAIATPLNAWWTGPELEYGVADSQSKVLLIDGERYGRLEEHLHNCPSLKRIYVTRATEEIGHPLVQTLESVLGAPNDWKTLPDASFADVDIAPDDPATIFYTSGTTGKPKGALGTHRNITTNLIGAAFSGIRGFLRRGVAPPAPDPNLQRVALLVVPLFHVTGCHSTLCGNIFTGGKIVLMRKWDAEEGMRLIEREKVNSTGGVPTIAWQIIEHPNRAKYDLSSLEVIGYGGAPSAPELVRKIGETFKGAQPGNAWGMTETSAAFCGIGGEDYLRKPDSCGVCAPTGEMKIVGPKGETLGPNQVGELWAKGPQVVAGYWNKPDATRETFVDGWVKTGDLAKLDDEDYCYIIDRAKDMLIRGGENIYCVEVENALYEHPAVMDAAIVAVPHRTLGEEPGAVVHLKPGAHATEEELRAWVAERLAAFKVPVKVVFWPEMLPRNQNQKILKTELKKVFAS